MVLIVLTALASHTVKRNATWYIFCMTWILSCISYTFIFLIGQQESPSFGPCLAQGAAIYSAPSLCVPGFASSWSDVLLIMYAILFQDIRQHTRLRDRCS
jgi:hypothetical protein